MAENELLTAGKLAEKWGVSAKKVKTAIEKSGVQPDSVKGVCKYYSPKTAEQIKKEIE